MFLCCNLNSFFLIHLPYILTIALCYVILNAGLPYILPDESMIKAIDVWEIMCIILVFAGMLEFALIHAMLMRRKHIQKAKELEDKLKGDIQETEREDMVRLCSFCLITNPIRHTLLNVMSSTLKMSKTWYRIPCDTRTLVHYFCCPISINFQETAWILI